MGPDGEFTSSNNWPFISMKICLKALKITEVGSKFGQTLNKGLKDYHRLLTFRQSLVTLKVTDRALKENGLSIITLFEL